jgi:hypothetical protein
MCQVRGAKKPVTFAQARAVFALWALRLKPYQSFYKSPYVFCISKRHFYFFVRVFMLVWVAGFYGILKKDSAFVR